MSAANAFELGWYDAERGESFRACPFRKGSGEAIAWRNGYRAMYWSVGLSVT